MHRTKGLPPSCFLPCRRMQESCIWTLFKDVDCTTGRVKSSWEYFTVFAQPFNAIFSAQCCTHLIYSLDFFLNLFYFDCYGKACGCLFSPHPLFSPVVFCFKVCKPDLSLHWVFNMIWAFSIMSSWQCRTVIYTHDDVSVCILDLLVFHSSKDTYKRQHGHNYFCKELFTYSNVTFYICTILFANGFIFLSMYIVSQHIFVVYL